jgi:hypothetical protein
MALRRSSGTFLASAAWHGPRIGRGLTPSNVKPFFSFEQIVSNDTDTASSARPESCTSMSGTIP